MKWWVGIGVSLALFAGTRPSSARVFGQVFVHGKGLANLSDPSWAYDYWGNGQFPNAAQGCSGMPTTITHVDGTQGLVAAAFNQYDCGCGMISYFGCDWLNAPLDGSPDPGYVPSAGCGGHPFPDHQRHFADRLKQKGVVEQINDFLDASAVDDLTVVAHSMGGNVTRLIRSYTNFYDACAFGSGMQPPFAECQRLRSNHLRVINAVSTVMALHSPFLGSEAADKVATLSGSWLTGWIADWLNPYDPSTRDCTTKTMGEKNLGLLYGTSGRPFPTLTSRGESLRVPRWISLVSPLYPSQVGEEGGHVEDLELLGLEGAVSFTKTDIAGRNDGLVSLTSMAAVYTSTSDRWFFQGQHDAVAVASGVNGYIGNNHFHASHGFGPRYWRPVAWDNSCAPLVPGFTGAWCGCETAGYYGAALPACPDPICKSNQTRGYPAGADEAFAVAAFTQARAAAACGPSINYVNVFNGRYCPVVQYVWVTNSAGLRVNVQQVVGYTPAYDYYAPNAGAQICNFGC
jgi:hypothetical protein